MTGIHFSIWAILILFGAAQGLFLALYLFARLENRSANKWLALLLAVVSLHMVEYAADITGVTLQHPVFIAITYPLLFCMGPLYWLYCRSLPDGSYKTSFKSLLHFLPPLIVLLLILPFYTMPGDAKTGFLSGIAEGGTLKIPAGQLVFMGAHVIQTVAYIFAAWKFIRKKEEELKDFSSDAVAVKKLSWLNAFSRYFFVYFLLYFLLVVLLSFINSYQLVELDYLLLLIMAMSMYAIGYSAISSPEIFNAVPEPDLQSRGSEPEAQENSPGNAERFPGLKERLLQYMDAGRPWLKSDLKISELAAALGVPAYQLSQVINEGFLVNFYDFVNKYRVEEAKKLLVEDTRGYKILAIGYEVGFNSKATFNRVFKNATGLTPSEYRERFTPEAGNPVSPPA
jgi:AraC-like DNA-binding protein